MGCCWASEENHRHGSCSPGRSDKRKGRTIKSFVPSPLVQRPIVPLFLDFPLLSIMPPSRLSYRRRSSLAACSFVLFLISFACLTLPIASLNHIKPGIYGAPSPSPRSVTFAPNVTPGTFNEADWLDDSTSDPSPPSAQLFPPSEVAAQPAVRRRAPPGKRRSLGYIPRPPNAFMLFRADFVRQKHVPGSIETNHGSLSKIIGECVPNLFISPLIATIDHTRQLLARTSSRGKTCLGDQSQEG